MSFHFHLWHTCRGWCLAVSITPGPVYTLTGTQMGPPSCRRGCNCVVDPSRRTKRAPYQIHRPLTRGSMRTLSTCRRAAAILPSGEVTLAPRSFTPWPDRLWNVIAWSASRFVFTYIRCFELFFVGLVLFFNLSTQIHQQGS